MIYLFDTNILIEASNRYYGLDFAPGFWHFIEKEAKKITLKSSDMVLAELQEYEGELSDWAQDRKEIFDISSDSPEIQENFKKVANYVNNHAVYSDTNKAKFLAKADPWLIATAMHLETIIVTHEVKVADNSKQVKIPNVAHEFGVETINTFEMIRRLGGKFELSAP